MLYKLLINFLSQCTLEYNVILFSIEDGKIRWERLFTTVGGSGEPVSYLLYFLIALGGYIGYSLLKKNKKEA